MLNMVTLDRLSVYSLSRWVHTLVTRPHLSLVLNTLKRERCSNQTMVKEAWKDGLKAWGFELTTSPPLPESELRKVGVLVINAQKGGNDGSRKRGYQWYQGGIQTLIGWDDPVETLTAVVQIVDCQSREALLEGKRRRSEEQTQKQYEKSEEDEG